VLRIDEVVQSDLGDYLVKVTNPHGMVISRTATLSLPIKPNITVQPVNQFPKMHGSAEFTVQVIGTEPFDYQWYKEGEKLNEQTGSSLR